MMTTITKKLFTHAVGNLLSESAPHHQSHQKAPALLKIFRLLGSILDSKTPGKIALTWASVIPFSLGIIGIPAPDARAQQIISVEERFQDVFLTAGYCTAFGAAFGTALLAWTTNPSENLKYIAIGASLGFIGGSALGTYVVLKPMADVQSFSPDGGYSLGQGADHTQHVHSGLENQQETRATMATESSILRRDKSKETGSVLVLSPVFNLEKLPRLAGMRAQITLLSF